MSIPLFHLAFPVHDLEQAKHFYGSVLGCQIGRYSDEWIDFNFEGHQIVAHLSNTVTTAPTNTVDGKNVPVRHFGLILAKERWEHYCGRLEDAKIEYLIAPTIRFKGKAGEQGVFFAADPSQNALEFKYFKDKKNIFAR